MPHARDAGQAAEAVEPATGAGDAAGATSARARAPISLLGRVAQRVLAEALLVHEQEYEPLAAHARRDRGIRVGRHGNLALVDPHLVRPHVAAEAGRTESADRA